MTERQAELLKFIISFQGERGFTPSFEEMRLGIGVASKCAVAERLARLEADGFIARARGKARAIFVLKDVDGRPTGARKPANLKQQERRA